MAIDPKRYPPGKNPAGAPGSTNVGEPASSDEGSANDPTALAPEEQAKLEQAKLDMAKQSLLTKLNDRVKLRTAQRKDVELRWLQDLRQYHGKYEPEKLKAITDAGGSQEFVNITRSKTNTFAARVADMLLPTDDKNWGLEPTPVPELDSAADNAVPLKDPATGQPMVTAEGHEIQARDAAAGLKRVAEARCEAMEREIDDQLAECNYNAVQRDVIDDMALYGTGILKGPILTNATKRRWHQVGVDSKGIAQYELEVLEETKPAAEKVSVWNFFPDMNVTSVKQGEDVLERHPSTRKDLIDLAKLPGFDKEALRDLIRLGPQNSTLWYLNELRAISNQEVIDAAKSLWEVWEWHGPLDADELRSCGLNAPDDPLLLVDAVVWFCDSHILKATLNPMDTGDRPYSVCYCEKDDTSVFGFGYPYLLRNPQNVACGAWRMLIDNAGLSVGPQIIVNRKAIEPADGDYKLKPRKVWEVVQDGVKVSDAFMAVPIDAHQTELLKLFELATSQADVETNLPLIAQGIESPEQPDSATGLSIFNNNASVVLRRSVKSYDDDMTTPTIGRFFDWNMQLNPKEDIKGDWRAIAKGAGVLMEKERMAQAIVKAMEVISKDPDARILVNKSRLYEGWFRAMRLDDAMNTEDEKAQVKKQMADEQAAAQQQAQGQGRTTDPAMIQIAQRRQDLAEKEFVFETQAHEDDYRFKITALAETLGLDEKKVMAGLAEVRLKLDGRARELNAKSNFHAKTGEAV